MEEGNLGENIQKLREFTAATEEQAVQLLQLSNYDVDLAINKVFEAGSIEQAIKDSIGGNGWQDAPFNADRYGQQNTSGNSIPAFNIEYAPGVDHYPYSVPVSVAPSRPPSPASHHSATSQTAHRGDSPIQSIEAGQESGVTGNSAAVFGPANRSHYDESNWGLVLSTDAEVIPDPQPAGRKREEDGPAIIKPVPNGDYLPALLCILNSIPLYRNTLLAPEIQKADYTAGDEWWKGVVAPSNTGTSSSTPEDARDLEVIYEVQRLMAFLDCTDRAYVTVGGLQQLESWKDPPPDVDGLWGDLDLLKFLLIWGSAYEKQTSRPLSGTLQSLYEVAGTGERQNSFLLDATVPSGSKTIYDVLDAELLGAGPGRAHIVSPSNVLIMRLENSKRNANTLGCKVPSTFYIDRYLQENQKAVKDMFGEMEQYRVELNKLDSQVDKHKYHTLKRGRPGEKMEALQLIKTSMDAFDPSNDTVLTNLKQVYDGIEKKLKALEKQKKKTQATLDSITARFRAPWLDESDADVSTDENTKKGDAAKDKTKEDDTAMDIAEEDDIAIQPLLQHDHIHPYRIAGASTNPRVYYIRHPESDEEEWWRIEYSTAAGSDADILREKIPLKTVLEKISSEHSSALVVYANETARSTPNVPLPDALCTLVRDDNRRFEQEYPKGWDFDGPIEPITGWNAVNYADAWGADSEQDPPAYSDVTWDDPPVSQADTKAEADVVQVSAGLVTPQSSTTLTPATDQDVEEPEVEMQEVSNRLAAQADVVMQTESDDEGEELHGELTRVKTRAAKGSLRDVETPDRQDVEMTDAESPPPA